MSSVITMPGAIRPVPEVTMNGLSVPASTSPMASMAVLSIAPFSANFAKSWMKARWITPSIPLRRAQAFEILQRASKNFRAQFPERRGVRFGAGEAET